MVPGPPISVQLFGAMVLVISLISMSSIVLLGAVFDHDPELTSPPKGLPPGADAEAVDPVGVPVGVPLGRVYGPVTGVGAPAVGWRGMTVPTGGEVGLRTSPKS